MAGFGWNLQSTGGVRLLHRNEDWRPLHNLPPISNLPGSATPCRRDDSRHLVARPGLQPSSPRDMLITVTVDCWIQSPLNVVPVECSPRSIQSLVNTICGACWLNPNSPMIKRRKSTVQFYSMFATENSQTKAWEGGLFPPNVRCRVTLTSLIWLLLLFFSPIYYVLIARNWPRIFYCESMPSNDPTTGWGTILPHFMCGIGSVVKTVWITCIYFCAMG